MSVPSGDSSPYRVFWRMVSPTLAAEGDLSFAVTGIILSSTVAVAVVAEVRALWVTAFLTGALDGDVPVKSKPGRHPPLRVNTLSRKYLDQDISDDVVWGNITGDGLNVDAIHYNDMLLQDLGLGPHRMGARFWSEMSTIYGPSAYAEIVEERLEMQARQSGWSVCACRYCIDQFNAHVMPGSGNCIDEGRIAIQTAS